MKDITEILFTENELEAIEKNEEAKNMVNMAKNTLLASMTIGILIGKGIVTEDEVSLVMEGLASSDAVKPLVEKIKQLTEL